MESLPDSRFMAGISYTALGVIKLDAFKPDLPARSSSVERFFPRRPTGPSLPANLETGTRPVAEAYSRCERSSSLCYMATFLASSSTYRRCASTCSASSRTSAPGTYAWRVSMVLSIRRGGGEPSDEPPSVAYSLPVLSRSGPRPARGKSLKTRSSKISWARTQDQEH